MANDRSRRESQDRSGDDPEIWEVTYIVMEYDVSEDEARDAINAVGNRGSDVDRYFRDKGRERTGRGNQGQQQGGRGEEGGSRQNMGSQGQQNTGTGGSSMGSSGQESGRMEGDTSPRQTTGTQQSVGNTGTGGSSGQQSGSGTGSQQSSGTGNESNR